MTLLSNHIPGDDEIRMAIAEFYLFDSVVALPPSWNEHIAAYIEARLPGWDIEADLASELTFLRGTAQYARHAAGLPPMEPPTLEDLNAAFRAIDGRDLSIIQQIRDN